MNHHFSAKYVSLTIERMFYIHETSLNFMYPRITGAFSTEVLKKYNEIYCSIDRHIETV